MNLALDPNENADTNCSRFWLNSYCLL